MKKHASLVNTCTLRAAPGTVRLYTKKESCFFIYWLLCCILWTLQSWHNTNDTTKGKTMHVSLTMVSGNEKVGPIPVSTTEAESCPSSCPLMSPKGAGEGKGAKCYAAFGPLGMHWRKVGKDGRGIAWTLFCKAIKRLPKFQLWRHNQAGDLPKSHTNDDDVDMLDWEKCDELAQASKGKRGWTYTHYDMGPLRNRAVVKGMNDVDGFTVNLSADNLSDADYKASLGIGPVCVILPSDAPHRGNKTPNGLPVVVCPAQTQDDMSCVRCKLCQVKSRKSIVGFLAHGTAKKSLSESLTTEE